MTAAKEKFEEIIIDLPHIRLTALRYGKGKHTVIALHGWLDNAMSFARLAPYLLAENPDINILAIELAGHGHSQHRPLGGGCHFGDYLYDLYHIADALGIKKFDLLTHSLGSAIASFYAGCFPEQVGRMVCIELYGSRINSDNDPIPARVRRLFPNLDYRVSRSGRQHDLEALIRARLQVGEMKPENAELLLRRSLQETPNGWQFVSDRRLRFWQPSAFSEEQVLSFMREITASVLMIEADQGHAPQMPFLQARYEATRDIQVKRLSGGHHLHMDNAEAVAAEINKFWKEKEFDETVNFIARDAESDAKTTYFY